MFSSVTTVWTFSKGHMITSACRVGETTKTRRVSHRALSTKANMAVMEGRP